MNTEIIKSVLTEILEEQKVAIQITHELGSNIKTLAAKVESFQEKFDQQKEITPTADLKVVQEIVTAGILQIQQTIASQPKSIIRNCRLLLFPEMNAEKYYRIVFGRLVFWMIVFLFGTYLFILGKHGIESWTIVKQKEFETEQYIKAWHYLYHHEKKLRVKMDSAWVKSR
jgi:hypothetical protein